MLKIYYVKRLYAPIAADAKSYCSGLSVACKSRIIFLGFIADGDTDQAAGRDVNLVLQPPTSQATLMPAVKTKFQKIWKVTFG